MNKTININLAGIIFHLDEEAYEKLTSYLTRLKKQFQSQEGGDEILIDIEARIAEIFNARLINGREVVGIQDVDAMMGIMGQPEDYADVEDEEEKTSSKRPDGADTIHPNRRLYRDSDDNILGGVASGLAHYFSTDPIWIRLIFLALMFGGGFGFYLYVILWIVVPAATTTAQKLQMRGEKINITNIERSVKEELKGVSESVEKIAKRSKSSINSNKIGDVIEDIVNGIIRVLGSIFRIAFKILGIGFLVGGTIFLVVMVALMIGYGVDINGANFGFSEAQIYLDAILPNGFDINFIWLASFLTIIGPLSGLVYLGGRILFNYKMKNKLFLGLAGFATFVGIVLWIVLGITTATEFDSSEQLRTELALEPMDSTQAIEIRAEEGPYSMPHHGEWYIEDGEIVIDDVRFDVRPTYESEPYLEIIKRSQGPSERQAEYLAENTRMNVLQDGNILYVDRYLRTSAAEKYRAQSAKVILYLPVGYSVFFSTSSHEIIHNIENVTNTYDSRMINHIWYMSEEGLECLDCSKGFESNRSRGARSDFEAEWIEEAQRFEANPDTEEDLGPRTIPSIPSQNERKPVQQLNAEDTTVSEVGVYNYSDSIILV